LGAADAIKRRGGEMGGGNLGRKSLTDEKAGGKPEQAEPVCMGGGCAARRKHMTEGWWGINKKKRKGG